MYQKCPNCEGTGVENSHLTIGKFPIDISKNICTVCRGTKIIDTVTGLPPKVCKELTHKVFDQHTLIGEEFKIDIEK